jgi:hypothetical protein
MGRSIAARHGGGVLRVGQRGGDDEADKRGPCGGDRGRRRRRRAAHTQRRGGFWQIRQGRTGRDGPSACARWPAVQSGPARVRLGRVGRILRKNSFRIKIGFLNLPRLWKFVEGDLGGILTRGIFLNSSRLLKDFRKI